MKMRRNTHTQKKKEGQTCAILHRHMQHPHFMLAPLVCTQTKPRVCKPQFPNPGRVETTVYRPSQARTRSSLPNQPPPRKKKLYQILPSFEFSRRRNRETAPNTVASKIIIPEKLFFSELIRRGVIYYAGKFLPQIIFVELSMRGNSVSHYVDRLFWRQKITLENQIGINFFVGQFQNYPTESALN